MKTTFIHSSYQGSYPCECEILKEFKKTARVRYTDPISEEVRIKTMLKTDLAKWEEKTELQVAQDTISKLRAQNRKLKRALQYEKDTIAGALV